MGGGGGSGRDSEQYNDYLEKCDSLRLAGVGGGQVDRVSASRIAAGKAAEAIAGRTDVVAASDAFFPFTDGPELLLDAGVSGIFVHQMWTLRCPKCGYWSLSIPRSGFKQTGDIDEDGWRILERKKCQFRKRGFHTADQTGADGGF